MVTYNNGVVMLSYKEYKQLNESLYGAFNLGLRSHGTVGGIMSSSSINGTEAALEAEAEEAIEEAKKMKKKMDCDDSEDDEDEDEDMDKVEDDKEEDEDEEDEGDEEEDEDEEEEEEEDEKPKFMKKKAKKEWSEVFADLETVLEGIEDAESMYEIKKGMQIIKEGLKKGLKGHKKGGHKKGCDCNFCKNMFKKGSEKDDSEKGSKDKDSEDNKPDFLKNKDKDMEKKCGSGKYMEKKCGSNMKKEDADWWNSVHNMINSNPDQKNWDGVWQPVGEVQQAVREGEQFEEGILQDIGKSKFVRSAVTAAGLGAAAMGGYASGGMGAKAGGMDASGGRSVATANQRDLGVNQELTNKLIEPSQYSGGFEYMTFADRTRVLNGEQVKATPEFIKAWEKEHGQKAPSTNALRGMEGGKHSVSWN